MESFYLIAGLGNPGAEYAKTRHNAGFLAVDLLAERWSASWRTEKRHQSEMAQATVAGRRVWLCKPQTFMNASGEAVASVSSYFSVDPVRILVLVDDADLKLGQVRLRADGSSGGHHGLESIEQHLGTRQFARLRIGIGRAVPGVREITGHVLGRFTGEETKFFERVLGHAASQAECWLVDGTQTAMNRYNGNIPEEPGLSKT